MLGDYNMGVTWSLLIVVPVAILVLWFLQKKLKIFSRGTIAFMVLSLMIFTAVDIVSIMNEIRNTEHHIRTKARRNTVNSLIHAWVKDGPEAAANQLSEINDRNQVLDRLKALSKKINEDLADRNSSAENLQGTELVAISIKRSNFLRNFVSQTGYSYEALLDDGQNYHHLKGRVYVENEGMRSIVVADMDGALSRFKERDDRSHYNLFNQSVAYRNASYRRLSGEKRLIKD
jgi:hypothetical protein